MDNRNKSDTEELSQKEMKNTKGGAAVAVGKEPKLMVDAPAEALVKTPVLPVAKKL